MSRSLIPRAPDGTVSFDIPQSTPRLRKISTACGACKQRKTRCSGSNPCDACASRNSQCLYNATADQRRKIANQHNVQALAEVQHDLEKQRQLLGGMIATFRVGDFKATEDLLSLIRAGTDLSQLAAHVRNECRSNYHIQQAYDMIDFIINGEDELPSPHQILARGALPITDRTFEDSSRQAESESTSYSGDVPYYGEDGEPSRQS